MISDLTWLQDWYRSNCDGTWEHGYGVHIDTVDNPGWHVTINLKGTRHQSLVATAVEADMTEQDWVHCFIRDLKFEGAGDSSNLEIILRTFRSWVESWDQAHSSSLSPDSDLRNL